MDPPFALNASRKSATPGRSVSEVLSEKFSIFDHHAKVVSPYEDEAKRDAEFMEKLNAMLLELLLEFHAWAAARPTHVSEEAAERLEKEVKALQEMEREQGTSPPSPFPRARSPSPAPSACEAFAEKTRQKLEEFIARIKLALAALTGLAT